MMIQIELTNEERLSVLNVFENQTIRVEDYLGALSWKKAMDSLISGWRWRLTQRGGIDAMNDPDGAETLGIDEEIARIIVVQLMMAIKSGLSGRYLWNSISVIEKVRAAAPDAVSS